MAVKTERESFPMTADYLIVLFADVAIVESPIRMFTLPYFSLSSGQTVFSLAECVPGVFFTLFSLFFMPVHFSRVTGPLAHSYKEPSEEVARAELSIGQMPSYQ